ncbi:hypothetical protein Poli38472_009099 [Pythium oligandrum]|uniref:G-patch domain-containing protein n=1 Tax=Pythium oligandrum TaxID=41045 RepID=A0A8K1CM90_PYTOL|nr:hypothetical protein Poli38472_009099 [Pythium oligandrum]|eukprot:TMW64932.1 hypothetical protein Poli38472_009099 [Pythium oligandrum]
MKRSSGWNNEVTDEQGRRRFHGAFTGGFSAGYFNSVGSKDGWQPSTFSSSRTQRAADAKAQQRPEDFMDEEDDPLLGRRLETADKYDTLQGHAKQRLNNERLETRGSSVLSLPDEWILPASDSIGKKLLNQMGWKEGHGIGPKLRRRKLVSSEQKDTKRTEDREAENEEVYVPPRNTIDANVFPAPKLDKYGAGFDPYVNAPEFAQYKRDLKQSSGSGEGKRQIVTFSEALRGSTNRSASLGAMGFGLSALEDNDDVDVYDTPSMNDFDRAIGPAKEPLKLMDAAAVEASRRRDARETNVLCSDGRPALPGFHVASTREKPPKSVILRLEVPSEFKTWHVFNDAEDGNSIAHVYGKYNFSTEKQGRGSMMTASQRAQLLGESTPVATQPSSSVFDLLDATQKEKLMESAKKVKERQPLVQGTQSDQFRANITASIAKRFVSASSTTEGNATSGMESSTATKKSHRTEEEWAPHALLCKRFHVKCQGRTISGRDGDEGAANDLFSTELAPHLMDYAAGRQEQSRASTSEPTKEQTSLSNIGEDLPPLPVPAKPSSDLLKSIFEPSDESEAEEDEASEDEQTASGEEDEKVNNNQHKVARVEGEMNRPLPPETTSAQEKPSSIDNESTSPSEDESSGSESDERSRKRHKKSKSSKRSKSSKKEKKKKSKKHKKESKSSSSKKSHRRSRSRSRSSSPSRSSHRHKRHRRDRSRSRD